ncbi:IS240 transposase [Bacillus cytotoxicus]|uniref:IS240 transposase n=1 Tax=Bacillus cytotoxicus TaxID=580165 RepID=A0AAX2CFT3_9BACI|nr:IS240 transposase [Bacillus cytotoxicus]
MTVDKNPAYPIAIEQLKKEQRMLADIRIRRIKYLNNIIEQDHRFIKKRVRTMLGLKSFQSAKRVLAGLEAMRMIKKGQTLQGEKSVKKQIKLINQLVGLTA